MEEIELRHLRSFLAVAETLHFGRAAARLHITQPPLTRQIQQLEEALGGVRLFDRSRRRVALTEAGESLVAEARQLLDRLGHAVEHTRRVARGEVGRLRIGFITPADYSVLPGLLGAFRRRFPDSGVELLESTGDEQLRLLQQGALDAGILIPDDRDPGLAWMPLYRERLVAVLPRTRPLARRRGAIPAKALRDEPFVLFPRTLAPSLYDRIIAYTRKAGFSPRVDQEARQMQTIIGLVAGGLGVSIVPACMQNLRRRDVVYERLSPATPEIATLLAWRKDGASGALHSFLDVCRRRVRRASGPTGRR